jgi:TolA-binding protein
MSQLLIALMSGGAAATVSGTAAIVRAAYQRGKAAGRSEVTLETLQHVQAQTGQALEDIAVRLAQLEHDIPTGRVRRWRKA